MHPNLMMLPIELINTNGTCLPPLLWNQTSIDNRRPLLYVCIIATIIHSGFWLQLLFCPTVRQKTMQWLYAYLATDILLLFRFFSTFIVHTVSKECTPSRAWYFFICYSEAAVDNYLNVLEVYILLALNLCRYLQIARNKNVYVTNVRLLTLAHVIIYLLPFISFILQFFIGWARLVQFPGDSCDISYVNVYSEILNTIIAFALPISLNILVIFLSIRHVHLTSRINRGQHHVSAREKYHRSLVIQFLVFYTVWLSLWSPNIIVYQFTSGTNTATLVASLLNYIEIALDPIIISALDVRFQKVWSKLWTHFRNTVTCNRINQRRIVPIITNQNAGTTRPYNTK